MLEARSADLDRAQIVAAFDQIAGERLKNRRGGILGEDFLAFFEGGGGHVERLARASASSKIAFHRVISTSAPGTAKKTPAVSGPAQAAGGGHPPMGYPTNSKGIEEQSRCQGRWISHRVKFQRFIGR